MRDVNSRNSAGDGFQRTLRAAGKVPGWVLMTSVMTPPMSLARDPPDSSSIAIVSQVVTRAEHTKGS